MIKGSLQRPAREQLLAVAVLILAVAAAVAVLLLLPSGHPSSPTRARTPPAPTATVPSPTTPAAVVGTRPAPPAVTASQRRAATVVARRFLHSYLPVLYGRRPARSIVDADARVRDELAAVTPGATAPRGRRPRITRLITRARDSGEVIAIALIADPGHRPYQLACQLTRRRGHWRVSELSNY